MAMEPLPLGFGEFSITMDTSLASLWPPTPPPQQLQNLHCYQSVEEVKQRLAAATAELEAAREEVRLKERKIAALMDLISRTTQERDLLRQQHQLLLARELETMTPSSNSDRSPLASPSPSPSPVVAVDRSALFVPSSQVAVDRTVLLGPSSPAAVDRSVLFGPSPSAVDRSRLFVPSPVAHAATTVNEDTSAAAPALLATPMPLAIDRRSVLFEPSSVAHAAAVVENRSAAAAAQLELLAAKRPLPHKGQLVQAVMEAGPLLQNLLLAGPLPRWRNPPPAQLLTDAMVSVPSSSGAPMGLPWPTH